MRSLARLAAFGSTYALATLSSVAPLASAQCPQPMWTAIPGPNGGIRTLLASDISGTPHLYAGGDFTAFGDTQTPYVAAWNGAAWAPAGSGLDGTVESMCVYTTGQTTRLYAGGFFFFDTPTTESPCLARLVGPTWTYLPGTLAPNTWIGALWSYDPGTGARLFASGGFILPADHTSYIAQWNGATWAGVGGGLGSVVHDSVEWDDGTGREMYITGSFPGPGGSSSQGVGKWNGTRWAGVGGGISSYGDAIAVYDDGRGPALYIAGSFNRAGAFPGNFINVSNIARWNGTQWEPLGTGLNKLVRDLAVFDDGSGPKLYAAGDFATAGGLPASRIACWDGHTWAPVAGGMEGASIYSLEVFDPDGNGPQRPALYAAGHFISAGGLPAQNIAALTIPSPAADFDHSGFVDTDDYDAFVTMFELGDDSADFDDSGFVDLDDFDSFVHAFEAGC